MATEEQRQDTRESYTQFGLRDRTRANTKIAGGPPQAGAAPPLAPPPALGSPPPAPAHQPPAPGNADATFDADEMHEFREWRLSKTDIVDPPSKKRSYPWSALPTVDNDTFLHPMSLRHVAWLSITPKTSIALDPASTESATYLRSQTPSGSRF
ncbi:unnamed protein product [Rhizoctonia solani]|uniref:Uncharacterized protein n=1 Tax=Rhizoctonia solani TaxID=456999 RepID=A0A8H3DZ72_9AGAM|nr:unnamed protein product [Rhizoctonia solani]